MTQAIKSEAAGQVGAGAAIDRSDRPGNVGLLLVVAGIIVGAAIGLGFLANEWAQPLILAFLAMLSVIGVFCLFSLAIGLLQLSGRSGRNDLTKIIVDEAEDGVIVTESDNHIIYANRAYQSLSGAASVSEIKPVERLFAGGSEVSEVVYRLALAAREGRSQTDEIRLSPPLTGKSDAGWYRVSVSMTTRGDGRTASLWRVRDITRERVGQENVFQELQHAIDFLDHAPAGFMSIDPDGSVPYLNATLAGWLDYDLAKVGSGGLLLRDIAPINAVALVAAIAGKPGEVRTEVVDVDLRRRNGQSLPVRLHHEVAFGQDGKPGASRTLVLNRSPGEAGADAGTAAEARLARFFNNTPMAIATVGADGRIVRANGAFARLSSGLPATSLKALLKDADWAALQPALTAAGVGSADIKPLDVSITGEGERSARLFLAPVIDGEGGEEKAIVYALETTSERKLKENIDQAQKMQAVGQLAGGIAHDFNNVLQVIINASDFLLASHKPTDPSFQDIMQIKQNGLRAASLVRQLLAFSRRQTLRPQVLEYGDVLSDLWLMLKRVVGDTIGLDVRHGRDLWPIKADVGQLEQVIVNLAVNARDAMKPGGKLTLRTRNVTEAESRAFSYASIPKADYVLLEVEDTGTGIPQEFIDKIFDPFFTTKDVGKGTGLGLSMVYGIVKQTGGFVLCDSTVGKGTTFRIFLPRHVATAEEEADASAKMAAAAAAPAISVDHTGAGTILLVEDEDAVRALNARMLVSRGYTVLEADSGVSALREIEAHGAEVDLVVSDVVMPEMDGPTLLVELRKRNPKTRFVFVSGYAEEAFKKNLPEGESFHFLPKPFTMKQLVETVKAAMA